MNAAESLQALLQQAAAESVYLRARAVVLLEGRTAFDGGVNADEDTIFDLASLTKVISTTACFVSLWARNVVAPETKVERFFPDSPLGRAGATLEDLLYHRSGALAWAPLFAPAMQCFPRLFDADCPSMLRDEARRDVLRRALAAPLERPVGAAAVYSDIGFIVLGEILSLAAGLPLDALFVEAVARPLSLSCRYRRLSASPPPLADVAATGTTRPREPAPGQEGLWKLPSRPSRDGEVDDDNAWAMDGVAGHAGLFGTASDVAAFGHAVLEGFRKGNPLAPSELWQRALGRDERTRGSTRAMGFDTPSDEGSSAGRFFGRSVPGAVGHLGFTGTSLWIDLASGCVVALLTNRTALGRANAGIQKLRPRFHDAVFERLMNDNGNVLDSIDPKRVRRIHLVGVAGTGMGSFAGMLQAAGYEVTGSDENVYPPMSDMLKAWGIRTFTPYAAANLDEARPDLVIIGNVIRRVNPEAAAVRERNLPQMSFPAALGSFFLRERHSVVVAGTHGKTTTSSLMGHVLTSAGRDPSFLVGGVTQNYAGNFRVGRGPHFVVEGDEYDTAYFDKGPKFLHYQPRTVILTSIEFDHADIYRDLAHYESSFERLVKLLPADGLIAVSAAYPRAVSLARAGAARVVTYAGAEGASADYVPARLSFGPDGARFVVLERGEPLGEVLLPLSGAHNVENALGVFAAARSLGLSFAEVRQGFATFQGVKRRQEVRAEIGGVLVIDDFAHHPTAVRETIAAIRHRYSNRPLWAVFEPRSNTSRRNIHQHEYARSFTGAAKVSIKVPEKHDKVPSGEELDVERLVSDLRAEGIEADCEKDVGALVRHVAGKARRGDVVLVMSNGSFGGFIEKLLAELRSRAA